VTVGLADAFRYTLFGFMNSKKAGNNTRSDRVERGAVATLQLKNAASDVLDMSHGKESGVMGKLNEVSGGIKTARNGSKIFDTLCKGVNFASKLVNPILVIAGIHRAYKAEDKKSAAIKESGAVLTMFGAEWLYKSFFGLGKHSAKYNNFAVTRNSASALKTFVTTNKFLSKLPSAGVLGLIKSVGFIATSCTAFYLGGKAGKYIADRTTAKEYERHHHFKPLNQRVFSSEA